MITTKTATSIQNGIDTWGNDIWETYLNSPSGRISLVAEQSPEIVAEVMSVWGEKPTVPDKLPSSEPEPMASTPTPREDADALLIDHEYRLTLLELGVN